jgi:hypothetical protein
MAQQAVTEYIKNSFSASYLETTLFQQEEGCAGCP